MNREVIYETKGMWATDGAGVQLVRVFGNFYGGTALRIFYGLDHEGEVKGNK